MIGSRGYNNAISCLKNVSVLVALTYWVVFPLVLFVLSEGPFFTIPFYLVEFNYFIGALALCWFFVFGRLPDRPVSVSEAFLLFVMIISLLMALRNTFIPLREYLSFKFQWLENLYSSIDGRSGNDSIISSSFDEYGIDLHRLTRPIGLAGQVVLNGICAVAVYFGYVIACGRINLGQKLLR